MEKTNRRVQKRKKKGKQAKDVKKGGVTGDDGLGTEKTVAEKLVKGARVSVIAYAGRENGNRGGTCKEGKWDPK